MTTIRLEVRDGARHVGSLRADESNRFCFAYTASWLQSPDAFPVSITLPLGPEESIGGPAHAFFANLLPEGLVRQAVCGRLGISESNDIELLRAIGGECAGALSIVDPAGPAEPPESEYEELTAERLQQLVEDDDRVVPLLIGGADTRLSLAGAQDKVPVAILDGAIHLPLKGSPSTHILKLPNRRYPHLPQNEAFVLGLPCGHRYRRPHAGSDQRCTSELDDRAPVEVRRSTDPADPPRQDRKARSSVATRGRTEAIAP